MRHAYFLDHYAGFPFVEEFLALLVPAVLYAGFNFSRLNYITALIILILSCSITFYGVDSHVSNYVILLIVSCVILLSAELIYQLRDKKVLVENRLQETYNELQDFVENAAVGFALGETGWHDYLGKSVSAGYAGLSAQ